MSVEIIKKQVFDFLSSEEPEVIAIKGKWGVGKTFSWNKFLSEAKVAKNIKLKHYSYVSLFGINSLKEFKFAIFQNVINKEIIGTEVNLETFKSNSFSLIESFARKSSEALSKAPIFNSFSADIESISFLSLNKTIICIDDLERKGKELDIKDVLGLVSLLKEQKNCKLVLLLNDGEDGLEDYKKYREKVIDIELAFAPTSMECASIAYSNDTSYQKKLQELVVSLDIKNIRILKKIEHLVIKLLPTLEDFDPEVLEKVLHSVVLYSWSHYCSHSNGEIPPLDFIINGNYALLGFGGEEVGEQEKKWQDILHHYRCVHPDELELLLVEYIKNGYFVSDDLVPLLSDENQKIIAFRSKNSFFEAWRLYDESFDNNTDQVINGLYKSLKENCKYIAPRKLNSVVFLFRELEEDDKASEVIQFYIDNRGEETELFNLSQIDSLEKTFDSELIEKFNAKYTRVVVSESAQQVLYRICGTRSWDKKAEVVLANTTMDEYYQIFKNEKGGDLSAIVRACLQFGESSHSNSQQKKITKIATKALLKIASEDKLNRRRVRGFGIEVAD